ncbi:probable 26S proteasome regulatory subunit 10B isoform X2 [Momordica charantia]|uniref:Probable 26S proteasome regulatory subunit 10B isoform X2 n=1 Tax=Momordica charantia TaxID=3673 RepID=A0A6J1BTG0_MOMCH|nr:probable 26S proteasome regulatory subunit 10B isoform X2 [Momordica charantia]
MQKLKSYPQSAVTPPQPNDLTTHADMEEIAKRERRRIEQLIRNKGLKYGACPRFTVGVKGQKVTIKFQVPSSCEVSHLVANIVSNLGLKVEERAGGSDMLLRAWDSPVAWQLTLTNPKTQREAGGNEGISIEMDAEDGDLSVLIFHSLITSDKTEIEFIKQGSLSTKELDSLVSVLQLAGGRLGESKSFESKSREGSTQMPSSEKSISSLEAMGVKVYGLDEPRVNSSNNEISWDNIAGYDQQKGEIEDTILMTLHNPELFDDIARGTRHKFESNRPRAVLFEGPPGTGKTSCARVIANQADVPLVYVPLEVIMSKYYGESERLLGKVFSLANELSDGAIIFLDEVDSFAITRDSEMHEATRRVLSVLLRQIDGFEQDRKVVVIAATNRKQDLDPALISRFDSMITFGLPDERNRQEIASQYAKQLTKPELNEFARITEGMSGRDIRDICQQAERSWASKIIRGQVSKTGEHGILPPLQEYIVCAMSRRKALQTVDDNKIKDSNSRTKKTQLA